MGTFLDKPLKEKNAENCDSKNPLCSWGLCSMQGWRTSQEDAHIMELVKQVTDGQDGQLCCVFDGHGGRDVSRYVEKRYKDIFLGTKEF